jgi:hypothetical protein
MYSSAVAKVVKVAAAATMVVAAARKTVIFICSCCCCYCRMDRVNTFCCMMDGYIMMMRTKLGKQGLYNK